MSREYVAFDETMRKILSVSHNELKRREAEWKKERKRNRSSKRRGKHAIDKRQEQTVSDNGY
jgi:hypothetical protein